MGQLAIWHLVPPLVVAAVGFGRNADFRAGLLGRGHTDVVGIRGDMTVQPYEAHPAAPAQ